MVGTNHIDPALCLYAGAHLICIDNKHLKDKVPRGNGTMCRMIGVKLKENSITYTWKNCYRRKVWTINASEVEWVECEHISKTGTLVQLEAKYIRSNATWKHDKKANKISYNNLNQALNAQQTERICPSGGSIGWIWSRFGVGVRSFSWNWSVRNGGVLGESSIYFREASCRLSNGREWDWHAPEVC
jgi:hypothetical protein